MKLKYVTELNKHQLDVSDLPEDAQTGVEQINQVIRAVNMLEKKGKTPTRKTLNKVKAMDKWVSYEIIDFVNETQQNEDEIPHDHEDVIDEIDEQVEKVEQLKNKESMNNENAPEEQEQVAIDPRAEQMEDELSSLYAEGFRKFDIEDLQSKSSMIYELLFDTYEPDEDNGIETTKFKLLERTDGLFHLTKK